MSAMSNKQTQILEKIPNDGEHNPPFYYGWISGNKSDWKYLNALGVECLEERDQSEHMCEWDVYVPEDAYEDVERMWGRFFYSLSHKDDEQDEQRQRMIERG